MPCGTSHKFQGQEFDTVIVDLMQDAQRRWVGCADITGSRRDIGAAKLLNVALTRGKDRFFLIGDWDFIQRSDKGGMRALAGLRDHPNFRVLDASAVLQGASLA